MSKAIYKRKHFLKGLLIVLESESMIIMAGSVAAGQQAWFQSSSYKLTS